MKDYLKKIYFVLVELAQTIVSVLLVVLYSRPGTNCQLRKLRNKNKERDVSVLANGPSAREIIDNKLQLLRSCDLLAMNDAAISDSFEKLKPQYYILLDPAYFGGSWLGYKELTTNNYDEILTKLYDKLTHVSWEMSLLLPRGKGTDTVASKFKNNKYVKIIRYNATRIQGFDKYKMCSFEKCLGIPSSRNIIIPAILLMINAGYKNIYLYGAEFSWTKYMDIDVETGLMYMNDRHFYSKDEIRYFDKGAYKRRLTCIAEMLDGLDSLALYARKKGVNVVNRTRGSFIDSFQYENPDML